MPSLSQGIAQPFETFVEPIARRGAGGLDVLLPLSAYCLRLWHDLSTYPCALSQTVETELVRDFGSVHGILNNVSKSIAITCHQKCHTGRSCLLAKTKRRASRNSSSFNIRCNSSRASTTRSRSLLSTTKMMP